MEETSNHIQAFPDKYETGMTLRDYFAAKALQSELSIPRTITLEERHIRAIAKASYEIADAMLNQREK